MLYLNYFIYFIIFIKICFIILAFKHIYHIIKKTTNTQEDKKILYWKDRCEFIFTFLMAILLILMFSRNSTIYLTKEIRFLLFLFGIILLITAKWNIFFKESVFFKYFQEVI